MGFDDDTALRAAGDGAWDGEIAEGWDTPRGPLGGYVMAIVLRALELAVDDAERTARSATMHFLRVPRAGPVTVRAQVERAGRSLTSVSGRLEQDGKLLGLALGAWSKPWPGPTLDEAPMPEVDPPDPRRARRRPVSTRQPTGVHGSALDAAPLRRRPVHRLRSAARRAAGSACSRNAPLDALAVAICADAWFPAPWPRLSRLAPAPTIDLTIHFRSPLPLPDSLLLGRFRNRLVRDGFFEEDGELWAPDGTLVAQSRQLGLLIDPQV